MSDRVFNSHGFPLTDGMRVTIGRRDLDDQFIVLLIADNFPGALERKINWHRVSEDSPIQHRVFQSGDSFEVFAETDIEAASLIEIHLRETMVGNGWGMVHSHHIGRITKAA